MLLAPVESLPYIRGARSRALSRMGITTVRDLLENYPHRYLDMSQVISVRDVSIGTSCTVVGRIGEVHVKRPRPRFDIVEATLLDGTGYLVATWFRQPWMARKISSGDLVALSGTIEFNYGSFRMNSPFLEVIAPASDDDKPQDDSRRAGRIIPIHPTTSQVNATWMRRFVDEALVATDGMMDPLPPALRMRHGFMDLHEALRAIHFPPSMHRMDEARRRLAYDELLLTQLVLAMRRAGEDEGTVPIEHAGAGTRSRRLRDSLPFTLTSEQESALQSILCDMCAPRRMNRLLLGDVGTGKTVVAALAMAAAVDSGHQAAMMAPTTVLATQYAAKVGPLFDKAGISWALLTSATTASGRQDILARLRSGELDVAFGTHALIQEDVVFSALSLIVIDEQHRFGVRQRSALAEKGPGCDRLSMTATPIPRTLALTLYGDMDCSYLRTRPGNRPPVTTEVITRKTRARAYDAIRKAVSEHHQAYIVCPLVGVKRDDGDRAGIARSVASGEDVTERTAAISHASYLREKVFKGSRIDLLTGKMPPAEKDAVMERFRSGETDILVSTTVVEVGVDVPNATVMLVEDADCFGLSQLHQLRGRVGRGTSPGTVFLVGPQNSSDATQRLEILASTDDGFELARKDLEMRHEGDILGSRQSGLPSMPLVDIMRDGDLIESAFSDAREMVSSDPALGHVENRPLGILVREFSARIEEQDG